MQELTELRFNDDRILLRNNHVRSRILPQSVGELDRDVVVQGECIVDGAIFARNLEIEQGPCRIRGAVFTHSELHINSDAAGSLVFEKAVGSSHSIVSLAPACRLHFLSDVTAKSVRLRNAYVAGSIFADEIVLEDCVVIGGVFGSNTVELNNCIAGTFNAPVVRASRTVYLLLPSAFSVEMMTTLPGTRMMNLALADLGALMRGTDPLPGTGSIAMGISSEDVKAVLSGDGAQQIVRSYSIAGQVLAADLVDYDRLQNHFLLSCASLGSQLLRSYDLGLDAHGAPIALTPERIAEFFFSILDGALRPPEISGEFDIASIVRGDGGASVRPAKTPEETPSPVAAPDEALADSAAAAPPGESAPAPSESAPEATADRQPAAESTGNPQEAVPTQPESAEPPARTGTLPRCAQCLEPLEAGAAFCGNCGAACNASELPPRE